ncbi:inner membrane protein CreD [Klebsiella pneumoniae]|uniref:Inner membrane protein CreD n=1 Tax=Klebsiella pneumoniae TaxID=573 RepID=A0A447RZ53_KLEPN|nr:inner membrane protein CreD [Klebsiella pneumoniae]
MSERIIVAKVVDAIEQSTSGSQKLAGPLIAIPITETLTRMENQKEVNYQRNWVYYWLPESLAVTGKQTVESRRVGIYSGQVWHNALQIKASFESAASGGAEKNEYRLRPAAAGGERRRCPRHWRHPCPGGQR